MHMRRYCLSFINSLGNSHRCVPLWLLTSRHSSGSQCNRADDELIMLFECLSDTTAAQGSWSLVATQHTLSMPACVPI